MWRKETSSDGLGDEIVGAECSVLRSGLPVGMFRFSRRSLFKLRCQPTVTGHLPAISPPDAQLPATYLPSGW